MGIGFGVQVRVRVVVGTRFGGEARVRVVVGISSEVRRGTVGGEGEGQ